jgi:photosystem II stability/assembly factor-like uncharacterized protein
MKPKKLLFILVLGAFFSLMGCKKDKCPIVELPPPPPPPEIPVVNIIDTWAPVTNSFSANLIRVDFPTTSTGYICGSGGTVLKSTDGGQSWSALTSGTTQSLYVVEFLDENTGYVGGDGNTLLKTTDGGQTWTPLTVGGNIRGIYFFDANTGFISGGSGYLRKTTDGGQTWTTLNSGTTNGLHTIYFINSSIGFVCGQYGYLAKTIDGGANWSMINTGVTFVGNSLLIDVYFIDNNIGYCVGGNFEGTDSYILKSINGGNTWSRLTPPSNNITYSTIRFTNQNEGYAVGGYVPTQGLGTIIKTSDGGLTWNVAYTDNSSRLFGLEVISTDKILSVGNNTSIVMGN